MRHHKDIQYITIPQLTVGVLSDTQLSPFGTKPDVYDNNLVGALDVIKSYNCGVVVMAGDIVNLGYANGYVRYNRALDKVYGDSRPLMLNIMGNHDYYRLGSKYRCQYLFTRHTGSPLCGHYCINGYHFITVSQSSKSMLRSYIGHIRWLTRHLDMAVADSGDRPVFVITHMCGKGTVYGSDGWGDDHLRWVFDNYPTVVNFGGHSHYSLLDERSIWQGTHTAINTQSLSYVEMDSNRTNGSVPPQSYTRPMGMVMQFGQDKIDILRVCMSSGIEQKPNMRWTLPTAIDASRYTYTHHTTDRLPTISGSGSSSQSDGVTALHFDKGCDQDFVHSYKVVLTDSVGKELVQYYFSDFYLGLDNMADSVHLPLYDVGKGCYTARVYAVNSSGNVSSDCVTIDNVSVAHKTRYRGITSPVHRFSGI